MNKNIRMCPKCSCDSNVINSRISARGLIIRRRACQNCDARWSTAEIPYKVAVQLYDLHEELNKGVYESDD